MKKSMHSKHPQGIRQWSESNLVHQLLAKNENALSVAFKVYSPAMMSTARALLDPASAEDIVQDAWVTVMTAMQSYEGRASLKSWLCRIVRNKALNRLRNNWRERTIAPDNVPKLTSAPRLENWRDPQRPFGEQPDQELITIELKTQLDCELRRMSKNSADAVYFRLNGKLNDKEISETMSITPGCLRVVLHRAKSRLEKNLVYTN